MNLVEQPSGFRVETSSELMHAERKLQGGVEQILNLLPSKQALSSSSLLQPPEGRERHLHGILGKANRCDLNILDKLEVERNTVCLVVPHDLLLRSDVPLDRRFDRLEFVNGLLELLVDRRLCYPPVVLGVHRGDQTLQLLLPPCHLPENFQLLLRPSSEALEHHPLIREESEPAIDLRNEDFDLGKVLRSKGLDLRDEVQDHRLEDAPVAHNLLHVRASAFQLLLHSLLCVANVCRA
mmetsp:Transcript_32572/g.103163  ORF Transcript_32572/g.103163 Transcript_32572/m.103163 type:complete len:238 (-) Transcript_32572:350-1063(-)